MKNFNAVLIFIAITFFRFGFSTKNFTKNARQVNVETFIHTNTIIFPTTLFKTEALKSSSLIDSSIFKTTSISKNFATHSSKLDPDTKTSSIVISSSSASVNYKPTTKVSYTMTSTSSASLTPTTATAALVTGSCISPNSLCNATTSFDFIPPLKLMPLEYYRVNKTIQIFEVHCNHNAPALADNQNPGLVDFQIIPASDIISYIVNCAMFNHQKPVGYNDWVSLCSTISLVENICYLKTNTNLSHPPNIVPWENAHTAVLHFW